MNIDQTPSKLAPASSHTLAEKSSKHVSIAGSSYKKAITATFGITFSNKFLPVQLIYGGKTAASFPKFNFPYMFSLSANPKHFSNTQESLNLIDDIIPYIDSKRKKLNVPEDHHALLVMDVFSGQMTKPVKEKLRENNILFVRVPANTTNLFQPLDLTVNGSFKALMKQKFTEWYSKQIANELDKGIPLEDIEIRLKFSVFKPLHASWLKAAYNHMTSEAGRKIIENGWNAGGITEAVSKGLHGLEALDPFNTNDPLVQLSGEIDQAPQKLNPDESYFFVTPRAFDESSDDKWKIEETGKPIRNAFDVFED